MELESGTIYVNFVPSNSRPVHRTLVYVSSVRCNGIGAGRQASNLDCRRTAVFAYC